ncbi:MAG TPA: flagellar biosynthetic protein FliR [Bryobacteraceae bacterium]|nr:flagellar biosynthetic protein FliR [Bryobacteraceae bacterium]
MRGELVLSTSTLLGFLMTLARVGGLFVFVPIPGMGLRANQARIVLTLCIAIALFPNWPHPSAALSGAEMAGWLIDEAALGIGIGLTVGFVLEGFYVAAQIMGLQAGYAYASTIDPNSQADSSVLVIFAEMAVGLLFFALGLDREVIGIFARSMEIAPAGSLVLARGPAAQLLYLGGLMFSTGVRLALPIVAVLLLIDISLALLGRVNAQLQLLTIAFPLKMMVALTIIGWLVLLMPGILRNEANLSFAAARTLVAR